MEGDGSNYSGLVSVNDKYARSYLTVENLNRKASVGFYR
jgi:hypothetical protein